LQDAIEEEIVYNNENDPDSMESITDLPQERFMRKVRESWEGSQDRKKSRSNTE